MTDTTVASLLLGPAPLTADDVKAMRMADDVSFHVNPDGCLLRLYVRDYRRPAIFTATQQRLFPMPHMHDCRAREIGTGASVHGYATDGLGMAWRWAGDQEGPRPACFHSAYVHDQWLTIARSLKVGDTLHAEWVADNNSDTTREAGIHVDMLRLSARTARDGDPKRVWLIGVQAGRDNSARMVQRKNVGR